MRLLVNAEPFGFGPAAAAAAFARHLRPRVGYMAYAGEGHTLDLHRGLGYDAVHDMTRPGGRTGAMTPADRKSWLRVLEGFDAVLTATDAEVAEAALSAGKPVAFYDALSWYWRELPAVAAATGCLYICQDFLGVRARLARDAPDAVLVPPVAERPSDPRLPEIALLNLGGLSNPMWPPGTADAYALAMIAAVRSALPGGLPLEVAASSSAAAASGLAFVRPRGAEAMADLMARSRLALMTPGLGNIYEADARELPTAWLPPANGSQAAQVDLISEQGLAEVTVSWADLGRSVETRGSQERLMRQLADEIGWLRTPEGASRLGEQVARSICSLLAGQGNSKGRLTARFGTGGAAAVAQAVSGWLGLQRPAAA